MTRTEHQHLPRRTTRAPMTAAVGGVVLAASVAFGTAVGPASAETPADIINRVCGNYAPYPTHTIYTNCSGKDLSGANLTSVNLTYADLSDTDLTGANLYDANLTRANLSNTDLTDANLTRATLYYANLTRANLSSATLTGATLNVANLTNANLSNTDLFSATLVSANLTNANLTDATLNYANLTDATLTGSTLLPADITVPATTADGATVTWITPTAPAMPTGLNLRTCTSAGAVVSPGDVFPVGRTLVTCTVGNDGGSGSGTFTVTVTAAQVVDPPATGSLGSLGNSFFGFGS